MTLPQTAVLELTAKCNHRCFFCSCPWENPIPSGHIENELTEQDWKEIINCYRHYGVRHITFTGGEPTLRRDLQNLISHAHAKGYTLGLVTNGYAVDGELLRFLKTKDVLLSISVPGIETFHENTGVDNIERVLSLFQECTKFGVRTVANIAVSKKNLPELYENISYPILHGADYVLLNRFLPGGRGMGYKELLLTADEINRMLDIAEEVLSHAGINGHIGTEVPYCIIKEPEKYKNLQVASTCSAAKGFFVTDPEGYIKTCNHSPHRVCKWTEVRNLPENGYWQRFVTQDYLPKMCTACEHTNICDGGCREAAHVYYGAIDDNDPCLGQR